MHLCAVHSDVLYVGVRIGIVRRRDGISVEEISLAAEIVNIELVGICRFRHIEDAAPDVRGCREVLHMACARDVPASAAAQEGEVQIGACARLSRPLCVAAHPKIERTRVVLSIVAFPGGIGGVQTDVDDAVRIRAISRADIAGEDGLVHTCAVRHRIDVDPARIRSSPRGAHEERASCRAQRTARDADVGRCGVECRVCLRPVRLDVRNAVDGDSGACACARCPHHGGVCGCSGFGAQLDGLARARADRDGTAVTCLDCGAARGERRDVEIARFLDGDFLADGGNAHDGRGIIDRNAEVMPLHINGEGFCRIVICDGGMGARGECRAACRNRRLVLCEDVAAVRLAHAVTRVFRVNTRVRDGDGEILQRLIVVDGRRGAVSAAMICAKGNIAKSARHLRAR